MTHAQVHVKGELLKGEAEKLKKFLDAKGYAEIRAEQSPHDYWQAAEFIEREFK